MEKKLDTTKLMVGTVTAALVTTSCSTDLDEIYIHLWLQMLKKELTY